MFINYIISETCPKGSEGNTHFQCTENETTFRPEKCIPIHRHCDGLYDCCNVVEHSLQYSDRLLNICKSAEDERNCGEQLLTF